MNMLQSFNQVRTDQQNKQKIHKYENIKYDTKEAVASFFPESDSQNTESKQNIVALQNHLLEFSINLENKTFPSKEKPRELSIEFIIVRFSGFAKKTLLGISEVILLATTILSFTLIIAISYFSKNTG